MAKRVPPLSEAQIRAVIRAVELGKEKVGKNLFDGKGLVIEVRQDGTGTYGYPLHRYRLPDGRRPERPLASHIDLGRQEDAPRGAGRTLNALRIEVLNDKELLALEPPIDPVTHWREKRRLQKDAKLAAWAAKMEAERIIPTFGEAVARYVKKEKGNWTSERYAAGYPKAIQDHVGNLWDTPVNLIDAHAIVRALEESWQKNPVTGAKVRARIEAVLNFATAAEWRSGDNPAALKVLKHRLPAVEKAKTKVKHMGAIPWRRIGEMMAALESREAIGAPGARFAILTAARAEEVRALTWGELDIRPVHTVRHVDDDGRQYQATEGATWTLPAHRSKSRRADHVVPLSEEALAILKVQRDLRPNAGPKDPVFPGRDSKGFLDIGGMRNAMTAAGFKKIKVKVNGREEEIELTMHGCARSTFRDWVAEATKHETVLAEIALQHVVGNSTERAYARSQLLDRRRVLMNDWGGFATKPLRQVEPNVVPMRQAG